MGRTASTASKLRRHRLKRTTVAQAERQEEFARLLASGEVTIRLECICGQGRKAKCRAHEQGSAPA